MSGATSFGKVRNSASAIREDVDVAFDIYLAEDRNACIGIDKSSLRLRKTRSIVRPKLNAHVT